MTLSWRLKVKNYSFFFKHQSLNESWKPNLKFHNPTDNNRHVSNETAIFWHEICYFTDKVSKRARKRKGKGREKKKVKLQILCPFCKCQKGKLDWPNQCYKTLIFLISIHRCLSLAFNLDMLISPGYFFQPLNFQLISKTIFLNKGEG